jgi:DNA-binding response OmpR family regulator
MLFFENGEFALLLLFSQNEGKTMGADYLYEKVWKQPMRGSPQALKTAMSRLRKKLTGCDYTINVEYGTGYRFEREQPR